MPVRGGREPSADKARTVDRLYESVVEQAPDAIYFVDARTQCLLDANPAFERLLGYSAEEIPGLTIFELVHDRPFEISARFQRALHSEVPIRGDREYRRKDGGLVAVDASAFRLQYGGPQLVCTVARDVTDRRKREKQISWYRDQLRVLTSQLFLAEQRERRRTAQVLHDGAGQLVTAAILRLEDMCSTTESPVQEKIGAELSRVSRLLRDASQEIRSLTLQLSPPLLAEHNLSKAVDWLARNFESQHGLSIRVQMTGTDLWFGDELSTIIYESLRELLTNVLKHARATEVDIRLGTRLGIVELAVSDNGLGFNPSVQFDPDAKHPGGFGLFSIGERLTHLGGGLDIDSAPGAGTRIVLHVPLRSEG